MSNDDVEHLHRSIAHLSAKIDAEEQAFRQSLVKRKTLVNELCAEAGVDPKYPDVNADAPAMATTRSNGAAFLPIKPTEFFGKSLSGSIRRVLELRSRNPATVEEIYRALVQGDYDFETRNAETAIQGLTVSIGKNSALFVKTPSGLIGLKEWYPGARSGKGRNRDDGDADGEQGEQATGEQPAEQQQAQK